MTRLVRSVRVVVVVSSIHAVALAGCTADDARECTTSAACDVGERCIDGVCIASDGGRVDGRVVDAGGGVDGAPADGGSTDGGAIAMDGATGPDAGGSDAGGPSVACGAASCTPSDGCCVSTTGAPPMCIAPSTLCSGIALHCDGPEDCAATEVCCNGTFLGAAEARCIGAMSLCPGVIACHGASDCAAGSMCCPFDVGGFVTRRCQDTPC